ncbi:MAG: PEGA domain-containing protein, partial [Sandaracinaceae bacterium]|nr:PEGA domain-containing protein [Sandaracinaceae bacterium]
MRALLLGLVLLGSIAHAQDARRRAAEHFDRGLAFYQEGRYDAALAEFSRAHQLAPASPTLYNLARVHAALGHAVEAAAAYEEYLRDTDLDARRRREAERALEEQRARIGALRLQTDVDGATVNVDGTDVGTTPLQAPLPLSAGTHALELRASGYETVRLSISVAGREELVMELTMRPAQQRRGTLRVTAPVPEVAIEVDGESAGSTPLASTLPLRVGEHVVRATRPGYAPYEQRVTIQDGAEAELRVEMRRLPNPPADVVGRVRLRLPSSPHLIRVDGEPMIGPDLVLPVGAHDLELEMSERRPYRGSVRVASNDEVVVAPPLEWTLEARHVRIDGAASQARNGGIITLAGAAVAATGIAFFIWNETEIARTDARIVEVQSYIDTMCPGPRDCDAMLEEGLRLNDL